MKKTTKEEAEKAVRTLLNYIGEDPSREGLLETPSRVIKSYTELFSGYDTSLDDVLNKRFGDVNKYNDMILLKSISFTSVCEHHMLPFSGTVDIAYIPNGSVVGLSKLARLVEAYARRLQIQERMTSDIAETLQEHLNPIGVAVKVSATHSCMAIRGATKPGSVMETTHFTGVYNTDHQKRQEFLSTIK
ncbi:MAG: GTP cyclohydrolase I FolE [Rickettsiaceae bacterium]|nr:GTP cyclohydrolase I FolE [Rickettsiaceae bacterium]